MADQEIELRYVADLTEPERALEDLKRKAEATPIAVGGGAAAGSLGGVPGRPAALQPPGIGAVIPSSAGGMGLVGGPPPNLQPPGLSVAVAMPSAATINSYNIPPIGSGGQIGFAPGGPLALSAGNWTWGTATVGSNALLPPPPIGTELALPGGGDIIRAQARRVGGGTIPPESIYVPGREGGGGGWSDAKRRTFFGPPNPARAFTLTTLAGREVLNAVEAQNRAATTSLLADDPISALQARQAGIEAQGQGLVGPIVGFAADLIRGPEGPTAQREQLQFTISHAQRTQRTGDLLFEAGAARTIRESGPTGTLSNTLARATVASEARQRGYQKEISDAEIQQKRPLEPDYLENALNPFGKKFSAYTGNLPGLIYDRIDPDRAARRQSNYEVAQSASYQVSRAAKTRLDEDAKDLTRTHAELERDFKFETQHLNRETDHLNAIAAGGYGRAFELDQQRTVNDLNIRQAFQRAEGGGPADVEKFYALSRSLRAGEKAKARENSRQSFIANVALSGSIAGSALRSQRLDFEAAFAETAAGGFADFLSADPAQKSLTAALGVAKLFEVTTDFTRKSQFGYQQQQFQNNATDHLIKRDSLSAQLSSIDAGTNAALFSTPRGFLFAPLRGAIEAGGEANKALARQEQADARQITSFGFKAEGESLGIINSGIGTYPERAQRARLNDSVRGAQISAVGDFQRNQGVNVNDIYTNARGRIEAQRNSVLAGFQADEAPSLNRVAVEDPGKAIKDFADALEKLKVVPDKLDTIVTTLKDAWKTQ